MAEPTSGLRGTKFVSGTENSNVRDVSSRIALLQPDVAPLIAFMSGLRSKEVADNPKFEWFEDELRPNTVTVSGSPGTGTSISVSSGTGVRCRVDDVLISKNGEAVLVTSISSDTFTVERGKGSVSATSIASGDQLIIAGNAAMEGGSSPTFKYTQLANKTNYIQIFRDTVQITATQEATKNYAGSNRKFQRSKVAMDHKRAIEQAFLFGDGFEDTTGSQARRGTKGLINWISTNVTDFGGVVTEAEFEQFLRNCFRYSPSTQASTKWFLASPIWISAINFWCKNTLVVNDGADTFGVRVSKYRSGHGDLNIARHWLLADFTDFQKYAFLLDPKNMKYRYLNGLDTKLHLDIGPETEEYTLDEYRTHAGLELDLEKTHGIGKNVTGFAA